MRDAQKPDHVSLNNLIGRLKEGQFVIPDFQREFEWKPWDINSLMRSIFLDYYIGSLLLWKGNKENFDALSCEVIYGFDGQAGQKTWNYEGGNPQYITLDGQQRLTAIFYAFVAPSVPLPKRAKQAVYFVRVDKFMEECYDEAFEYEWLSKRIKALLADKITQFSEHIFPLSVVGAGGWDLANWVQEYQKYWEGIAENAAAQNNPEMAEAAGQYAENARSFGRHLKGITEQYQVSYIELDQNLAVDKVCDIFTQINSRGIRLDVFDLINALLKPKGLQLKHMWREAQSRLAFIETEKMNVYVLQVMSILLQSYCSPKYLYYLLPGQEKLVRKPGGEFVKEVLIPDIDSFRKRWDHSVEALERGIGLLKHPSEFGAISYQYFPYVSILPVFCALQARCRELHSNQRLSAQRKIRHWYWASVFTNRYSGSVESTSARDFIDVNTWMSDDNARPPMLKEFQDRFRNLDLERETKKGTSVYNGVFNLLILQGARDWMSGNVPQHGDLDDHHIVPSSRAADDLEGINVHTILNRTPLSAETNRHVISNRLPNAYIPELMANSSKQEIRDIFESHFISPAALDILLRNPFTKDDYEEFIIERKRTILDAIEDRLIKGRIDLSPTLRELDRKLEKIELNMRDMIALSLNNDPSELPDHIAKKLADKIQRAARKDAAVDIENFQNLSSRLEFADLRELQDIITSKSTWSSFESIFVNKETTNSKFTQMAELRNCIRHSRSVSEVVRMEGEAAIIWFRQVLQK